MVSTGGFAKEYRLFSHIDLRVPDVEWLVAVSPEVRSVANFGCGTGNETLALMQVFDALEGIGIDNDSGRIEQAVSVLHHLKRAAVNIAIQTTYKEECREWWESEIPSFIKRLVSSEIPCALGQQVRETSVSFIAADMTRPLDCVPSSHFGLAYCRKVLYHIWCDQGEDEVQCAVKEMARVVVPGGHVVAEEPVSRSPTSSKRLDFRHFFEDAGLMRSTPQWGKIDRQGILCRYVYAKTSP